MGSEMCIRDRVDVDKNITAESFTGVFEGALSSSEQIADSISGSFTAVSGGLSTRITTVEGNVGGQAVNSTDSPTFAGLTTTGDVEVQGTLTAQELIVSSSVTNMTIAEKSGSTIFGDSTDDTHQFTGSVNITGSVTLGPSGSFIGDGSQLTGLTPAAITTYNNATDNRILTSVNSTTIQGESALTFNGSQLDLSSAGHATVHITGASGKDANLKLQNNSRLWIWQNDGDNTLAKGAGTLHLHDGTVGASRIIVNSTGLVEVPGGVSGSSASTGSFGSLKATAHQGDLYIQGDTSTAKLKIRPSINTGVSELHFSRYNRDNAGYISYNHTADRMDFYAAGPAQRMYMSYSGVNINQALVVGTSITAGTNITGG